MPDRVGAVASFHGGGLVTEMPNSPHLQAAKTKAQFLIAVAANYDMRSPNEKNVLKETFAKAVIFLHRTNSSCCMNLRGLPGDKEFIIDDLRALNSLLTGGTLARCPDIRFIHAHGDKTLPWVAHHLGGGGGGGEGRGGGRGFPAYAPQGVLHELQKIYVDTAGNSQDTMDDLRELGMMNQIMFGTDNPYGGQDAVKENLNRLMGFKLSQGELDAIGRGTAAKLLPKFA